MASFVTEVLASSGKLEKEDLAGKINKMSRKVADAKVKRDQFAVVAFVVQSST